MWAAEVHGYFSARLFPVQPNHNLDLNAISDSKVFVPVIPLFEAAAASATGTVLPVSDLNRFLDAQVCVVLHCVVLCQVYVLRLC